MSSWEVAFPTVEAVASGTEEKVFNAPRIPSKMGFSAWSRLKLPKRIESKKRKNFIYIIIFVSRDDTKNEIHFLRDHVEDS